MLESLKKEFHRFMRTEAGKRFRELHKRRDEKRGSRHAAKKIALIALGIMLAAAGVLLLAMPGPGLVVLAGGLMLLASESVTIARTLDYLDKKVHEWIEAFRKRRNKKRRSSKA